MHEAHPDRGDTQRAAAVFRDISVCFIFLEIFFGYNVRRY